MASRAAGPISIDGVLDDAAWAGAAVIDHFGIVGASLWEFDGRALVRRYGAFGS